MDLLQRCQQVPAHTLPQAAKEAGPSPVQIHPSPLAQLDLRVRDNGQVVSLSGPEVFLKDMPGDPWPIISEVPGLLYKASLQPTLDHHPQSTHCLPTPSSGFLNL